MAKIKKLKISILIPTYNGSKTIIDTLNSILSQNFQNFNIIIQDDTSTDDTLQIIKQLKNKKIKIYQNKKNLGYSRNLERGRKNCQGDILFLMGQDDILAKNALKNTHNAFAKSEKIGAVTRPYYWFFNTQINLPIRAKKQLNSKKDEILNINSDPEKIITMFHTLDQLSGLAYRIKYIDTPFHPNIFPCHVYPFASILKKHSVVFLKDYTIAVRTTSSQSRSVSWIYQKSPIQSWVNMFNTLFTEPKLQNLKIYLIKNFVATNYIGLIQIKNFSTFNNLLREIYYLIKYRPQNLLNLNFWFFSLGTIITPPVILLPMVDWYKNSILTQKIPPIKFNYSLK
ncbi:glycosyltransferase [Patescibacteria group bacterium]|nr:glycosyltransferase [Patescibacteria group bacterium]